MSDGHLSNYERDLGRQRIAEIRAQHPITKDRTAPADPTPAHDAASCEACLGHWCFWCDRAGYTIADCYHTVDARHGAPIPDRAPAAAGPEPEPAPEVVDVDDAPWPDEPSEEP